MNCVICREKVSNDGYGELVHLRKNQDGNLVSGSYFCYPKNWAKSKTASLRG